ncbi:uncharacterized protein EI90DRAFT_3059256 [Cantharellus anzutake]|uniref:uncharacterized protein n=1 Tax=Cantharellus anzutake TaxID=1750568 RepID=UPI001906ACF2|nr:uncharacterized protein EI90DRAFT_3059256 [Cantharellus anzutake]KAF8330783.1 hypothetical protein EI90DRAFT_3059256 [Cantharellus anzutake]
MKSNHSSSSRSSKALHQSLTPRITIFLLIVFILFLFTRLSLFPSESSSRAFDVAPRGLYRHFSPRDYLNESANDPAPFHFCPIYGPGDVLAKKYRAVNLQKSVLNRGSGTRIHRVIHKAMRGLPVTISVLGGSVSSCHGAGEDPLSPTCYPSMFFAWWNSVFPHPASELTNGARRKTDSSYYSYCNGHHLPDQTDLVILEFDSDDDYDGVWLEHFELLVRSILIRPDHPAVIILGHFSPQLQGLYGYAGPEQLHTQVAQFYDTPHVSIKALLYESFLHNPSLALEKYYADPMLPNSGGHRVLADALIHYMQEQICTGWAAVRGYTYDVTLPMIFNSDDAKVEDAVGLFRGMDVRKGDKAQGGKKKLWSPPTDRTAAAAVPRFFLTTRPDPSGGTDPFHFEEVQPFCVSANDLINPLPISLFVGTGWHMKRPSHAVADSLTTVDAYYWYAFYPASKLRVPVTVSGGDVAIWYLTQDSRAGQATSEVSCWVDNNYGGAKVIDGAAGSDPRPSIRIIDRSVEPGSHYVECQLQGTEGVKVAPFKLLGVFTT